MAARLTAFVVSAIVVVTFVAGLIVGAQREDDGGPADLIVHNARVYLGPTVDAAEALAIRDGKIVRVGSNKEIDRLRRRQTLDAQGGTVTPGLNDAGLQLFAPASSDSNTPEPSHDQKLNALRQTIAKAHRVGLTSVQTTIASAEELALLQELQKRDELKLHVFVALTATLPLDDAMVAELETTRKQVLQDETGFLKVGAVNLALRATSDARNGAVASTATGAAAIAKPRASVRKNTADQVAQLADAIAVLDRHRWQIILETPTAADVTLAADAFDRAFGPEATSVIRQHRHRVDLSTPVDATLAARIAALELVPSLPASALTSIPVAGSTRTSASVASLTPAVSPVAVSASAASKSETGSGPGVGVGSAPSAAAIAAPPAPTPIAVAANAATRPSLASLFSNPRSILRSEFPTGALDPLPAIAAAAALASAEESADAMANALDAYTSHAAYAIHEEPTRGTVAKDLAADLVIFSADLFTSAADRAVDPIVTATIVNGKVVFTQTAPAKPATTTEQ